MDDGATTLFWKDVWLDSSSLDVRFKRLFELIDNNLIIVVDMYVLGWGVKLLMWRLESGVGGCLCGRRS